MQRSPIKSSQIKSVGHDGDTLEVEFNSGSVYRYKGVPADTYGQLLLADSAGRFFRDHIRNSFPYERIPQEPEAGGQQS